MGLRKQHKMNIKEAQYLSKLNKVQEKNFKSLERAYRKCIRNGIFFHHVLGRLYAFNGFHVEDINFKCTKDSVKYNDLNGSCINFANSWADDDHNVHFYPYVLEMIDNEGAIAPPAIQ
jgi:hypothetical protein